MRLSYPIFETPIIFSENEINILVIENQKAFSEFVFNLVMKNEGKDADIVISENFEEVKFDKVADVITDIINIDCNNKKVISKLYSKLSEVAFYEENYIITQEVISKINEYLLTITESLPCSICFDENVELGMLFKSVSLKVETIGKKLLEKLCDYVEIMVEFCETELFVFVNLKSYLRLEELQEFYKFISYKKVNILIVENVMRDKIDGEKVKLIDSDLCEVC